MSEFDSEDDPESDTDPDRQADNRGTPSSIVNLGINVGVQSLTDLLGGVLGVSGASRTGQDGWEVADDTGRPDRVSPRRSASGGSASIDSTDEYLVETHRTDDEFVVTADLPGVSEEDLSVGIDVQANDLVVSADGRIVDRVSLPWSSTVAARVWFNNGVLEVRLRPEEGG